jgi:hypothetical protein
VQSTAIGLTVPRIRNALTISLDSGKIELYEPYI